MQVAEDWRGNESQKRTSVLAQSHYQWVPLPLNPSCLVRSRRSKEQDLSQDLKVCLLFVESENVRAKIQKLHKELERVLFCFGERAFTRGSVD